VAARLCAIAGPGEVLVGERTYMLVEGKEISFEELPAVLLRGKQQKVPLFKLLT
jgi:adenylate cyclase